MAYKLLDQNGNKMVINGMNKGTIIQPYTYNGLELYNSNTIATNRYAFYSSYRRVKIGSTYYYPTGSTHRYVNAGYDATSITINGRYSSASYTDYEVYVDGTLVISGAYTSTATDIYTVTKEANTSIIISGEWDSTNSKFIYNITTNATITRENSYQWDNNTYSGTIELTVGASQDITTTQDSTQLNLPSLETIRTKINSSQGVFVRNITKVEIFGGAPLYWQPGTSSTVRPWLSPRSSGTTPSGGGVYVIGTTRSSTSTAVFGSGYTNITTLMNESTTTPYYGWRQAGTSTSWVRMDGSTRGKLCDSSGNLPVYKIRVTYEY